MPEITLYTTHCPKCRVLEAKLKDKKADYQIIDNLEEIQKTGRSSVPFLEIRGDYLDFFQAVKYVNSL